MSSRIKERRLDDFAWTSKGRYTTDLIKDHGFNSPVSRMHIRFAFTVTADGVGTVGGLTQDASLQLFTRRILLEGSHAEHGTLKILDLAGESLAQFWHLVNDILGKEQDFSDPTPTVSSSADGRREIVIPFDSPFMVGPYLSYLDPREFSNLKFRIEFGEPADYAVTNLDTITNGNIEVSVEEIPRGIKEGRPHFTPEFAEIQHTIGPNTTADLNLQGVRTGAFIPLVSLEPHDDSAVGNAQRDTSGLIRRITIEEARVGHRLDDALWTRLKERTEADFPLEYTTTRRSGPVTFLFDRSRALMALLDNRTRNLKITLDTKSDLQQGITPIVAADNDRLDMLFLKWHPSAGMLNQLKKIQVA